MNVFCLHCDFVCKMTKKTKMNESVRDIKIVKMNEANI